MDKIKYFENIKTLTLLAKKEIGQNFLIDYKVAERIVSSLEEKEDERILEIGAGAGSISFFLSEKNNHVDLIDIDEGMLVKLKEDFKDKDNVHPQYGNAMDFDYSSYDLIIGNLPYYITTGIIENVLLKAKKCRRAVFMVQKEAARRIMAKKENEDYSPLNIYLNYVADIKLLFNVGRNSFTPIPHVDSSIILIDFKKDKHDEEAKEMYLLAKKLFLNRRKTIYNNLKNYLEDASKAEKVLKDAKIEANRRPEQLSDQDYLRILSIIKKYQK